jgi:oxaloacetate decarboxylase (Na+ extruding) subunit alpha
MATIEFVDQTLRDGPQSYWAMRLPAGAVTAVGPDFDRAGFRTIDLAGGTPFSVLMRYLREDPWDWVDWIRQCIPTARLRSGRNVTAMGGFGISSPAMLELFVSTIIKHGVTSLWVYDCLYNMDLIERACRSARAAGAEEIAPAIMYGISPVHDDAYFADRVRQMVAWDGLADAIYFEDAAGILTPDRAATLIPALVEAAGDVPVELHCHNNLGLAPLNYIEGIKHGVRIIHTASRPVANGPSLPSTEMMVENLGVLGHAHNLDAGALDRIAAHFSRVALQEGHPLGQSNEYDVRAYQHQLPGGMTGTFKAQLAQHGMEDRLPEVLEEIVRVRAELGHPISATPFSQLVGIQAVLNVTQSERYMVVPDEIVLYVMGCYGEPPAPMDPDVVDRVRATSRARELADWERPDESLEELRVRYGGKHLSDEELLKRYLAPVEDIEATRTAGQLRRDYQFSDSTTMSDILDNILKMKGVGYAHYSGPGFSISATGPR